MTEEKFKNRLIEISNEMNAFIKQQNDNKTDINIDQLVFIGFNYLIHQIVRLEFIIDSITAKTIKISGHD